MSDERIKIEIVEGDVLDVSADVLALKYAQHYYGSDAAVSQRLVKKQKATEEKLQPLPGKWVWVEPGKALPSRRVLFVGVPPLIKFGYNEIADWAKQAVSIAGRDYPEAEHIAITLHGPGFGLDEIEALHAELRGVVNAVEAGDAPSALRRVSIVERKPARVERLQAAFEELKENGRKFGYYAESLANPHFGEHLAPDVEEKRGSATKSGKRRPVRSGGHVPSRTHERDLAETTVAEIEATEQVENKPRAFVAMPFADGMEDVFYFGIQAPVRQLGYICERVDQEAFTGDILEQVKMRIENAEIVIADLTGANANVYLEVGFAWGKGRPTLLVANKKDDLKFDVRGQRCLKYQSIKDLEQQLTTELKNLGNRKP
jgi:hypothetical protein